MKKQYFVWLGDFGNVYSLYWAETAEQIKLAKENGYTRITRRQAEKLCVEENDRRNYDSNFSGYADNLIYPVDYEGGHSASELYNHRNVFRNGYLVEYRAKRLYSLRPGTLIANKQYCAKAIPEASDYIIINSTYDEHNRRYEYRDAQLYSSGTCGGVTMLNSGGYISIDVLAPLINEQVG